MVAGRRAVGEGQLQHETADVRSEGPVYLARRAAGVLALGGTLALNQAGSAQAIATGGTVTMSNLGVAILNPAANVTGIKLVAGSFAGQILIVVNQSANSVTFDIPGNSFVADGTSDVIAANTAKAYVWSNVTNLWYAF